MGGSCRYTPSLRTIGHQIYGVIDLLLDCIMNTVQSVLYKKCLTEV